MNFPVERIADPGQQTHANEVKQAIYCVQPDYHDREADQCWHAVRRQDPVIDLKHVQRAGHAEKVENTRKHGHTNERARAVKKCRSQLADRLHVRTCRRSTMPIPWTLARLRLLIFNMWNP